MGLSTFGTIELHSLMCSDSYFSINIMQVNEILSILQNRLISLTESRVQAVVSGNLELVITLDNSIDETKVTISQLEAIK